MLRLSKNDIMQGYNGVKRLAKKAVRDGDINLAVKYLSVCTNIGGQFNMIYQDDELDNIVTVMSKAIFPNPISKYNSNPNKWILYDDFCTTYVLAIQWIEAMAKSGKEILYITSRDISAKNRNRAILRDIEQYENVSVYIVPQGDIFKRSSDVFRSILDFNASKLVMHKHPSFTPIQFVLPILPKNIDRYIINLSDQTFWPGARHIDYCLEFRQFGASVSIQRRGLKMEQLLLIPFYPADDKNTFTGFPKECSDDKVIIFSGGDYYKTLDEGKTYWNLVKNILNKYPQVVFVFATKNIPEGDSEIKHFIAENNFEKRFIYIHFRPDIYQVVAHCDIFMGTCPTSGSLMSGLAAVNGKPILQYYSPGTPDDETEQAICYNEQFNISYNVISEFMEEADRLILNKDYRKKQGDKLKNAIISKEQFNKLVVDTLTSNKTQRNISVYNIEYRDLDDRWFYLERHGYINSISYLYSTLKAKHCLLYAPMVFLKKNINRIQVSQVP